GNIMLSGFHRVCAMHVVGGVVAYAGADKPADPAIQFGYGGRVLGNVLEVLAAIACSPAMAADCGQIQLMQVTAIFGSALAQLQRRAFFTVAGPAGLVQASFIPVLQ